MTQASAIKMDDDVRFCVFLISFVTMATYSTPESQSFRSVSYRFCRGKSTAKSITVSIPIIIYNKVNKKYHKCPLHN